MSNHADYRKVNDGGRNHYSAKSRKLKDFSQRNRLKNESVKEVKEETEDTIKTLKESKRK